MNHKILKLIVFLLLPLTLLGQKSEDENLLSQEEQQIIVEQNKKIKKLEKALQKKQGDERILTTIEVDPKDKEYINKPIVDINSDVIVKIDKDLLRKKIINQLPSSEIKELNELIADLEFIESKNEEILTAVSDMTKSLKAELQSENESVPLEAARKSNIRIEINESATEILNHVMAKTVNVSDQLKLSSANFRSSNASSAITKYEALYQAERERVQDVVSTFDQLITTKGYYFRMGAWMVDNKGGNTSIHLPGFDEYAVQDPIVIERFNFSLSAEQQQAIRNLETLAKSINENGPAKIFELLTSVVNPKVENIVNDLQECSESILVQFSTLNSALGDDAADLKEKIDKEIQRIREFQAFIGTIKARYSRNPSNLSSSELLIQSNKDIEKFRSEIKEIFDSISSTRDELKDKLSAATGTILQGINDLNTTVTSCKNDVENTTFGAINELGLMLANYLGMSRTNTAVLAFTDKVFKHDIDNLPSETRFSLITAGQRADGDGIMIRLTSGNSRSDNEVTMDQKHLKMFRVLVHSKTTVSMIFVDQFHYQPAGDPPFQAAPSYSVLFARGSRKSISANRLGQVAMGINISAPDLDQNGPDIAFAPTVSFLNHYVQTGLGYSVTANRAFWFFGVNLPLQSLNLVNPINNAE